MGMLRRLMDWLATRLGYRQMVEDSHAGGHVPLRDDSAAERELALASWDQYDREIAEQRRGR
jgi:hypothetical protein